MWSIDNVVLGTHILKVHLGLMPDAHLHYSTLASLIKKLCRPTTLLNKLDISQEIYPKFHKILGIQLLVLTICISSRAAKVHTISQLLYWANIKCIMRSMMKNTWKAAHVCSSPHTQADVFHLVWWGKADCTLTTWNNKSFKIHTLNAICNGDDANKKRTMHSNQPDWQQSASCCHRCPRYQQGYQLLMPLLQLCSSLRTRKLHNKDRNIIYFRK